MQEKKLGKKSKEKSAKNFFFIFTRISCRKKGGKRGGKIILKHSNNASKKCWEKIVGKKFEKRFFISHKYRDQKIWVQNERNNFSRNTRIVLAKNVGKKIVL